MRLWDKRVQKDISEGRLTSEIIKGDISFKKSEPECMICKNGYETYSHNFNIVKYELDLCDNHWEKYD